MARAARQVSHERFTPARGTSDVDLGSDQAIVGGFDGNDEGGVQVDVEGDELSQQIAREEQEGKDWDLPPEERGKDAPPRREREQRRERPQGQGGEQGEEGEEEEEVRLAYEETERGYEERRGRRSRRNRSRKEAITGRDQEIEQLRGQLNAQGEFIQRLTGGQMGLAARDLEARITYAKNALEMADAELARAVKEADGDAFAKITRARDEAARELWQLEGQQRNLEETARRTFAGGGQADQQRPQPQQQQLSPDQQRELMRREAEAERYANVFQDRYSWFDPQQRGGDNDVVHEIDQELIGEGYLPHTKAFWHEMEKRMREEGFRPNEDDDFEEERPQRRRGNGNGDARRMNGGRPPSGMGRGGRRPGGGGNFNLTEVETNMLRDEGLLEQNLSEEDLARRDRIIGKWRVGRDRLRRAGLA